MTVRILTGDCRDVLRSLPSESVHCCVTSPPYWGLRDYGVDCQIGLEDSAAGFVDAMVLVFAEVRRVLRSDGTLWLNLGDSYAGGGNYRGISSENTLTSKQRSNRGATGVSQKLGSLGKDSGAKPKDLVGIPWLTAFALRNAGWYLRQDIIWSKPNPMPESVTDRCTKAHEYLFMLSKSARYYYDADAIAEPGVYDGPPKPGKQAQTAYTGLAVHSGNLGEPAPKRDKQRGHGRRHAGFNDRWDEMERTEQCMGTRNKRSVWSVATQGFPEAHFATFPPALIEPCIKAGCKPGGTVLDPFGGAGTTGLVADRLQRDAILIELNPEYAAMAERRIKAEGGMLCDVRCEPSNLSAKPLPDSAIKVGLSIP